MTLSDPGIVPEQNTQRALEAIRSEFPLGSQHFQDGAITAAQIAAGAVGTSELADNAVTNAKMADDAIGAAEIADGAVGTVALAANAVTQIYTTTASTSGPSTTSAADPMTAVIPEMTTTQDFDTDPLFILFSANLNISGAQGANTAHIALYDGSTEIGNSRRRIQSIGNTVEWEVTTFALHTPADGSRTISARWRTGGGTLASSNLGRELLIVRLKR